MKGFLKQMPHAVEDAMTAAWNGITGGVKSAMWAGGLFEALGFKYMGPIDGHDLPELVPEIKMSTSPSCCTSKPTRVKASMPPWQTRRRSTRRRNFPVEGVAGSNLKKRQRQELDQLPRIDPCGWNGVGPGPTAAMPA